MPKGNRRSFLKITGGAIAATTAVAGTVVAATGGAKEDASEPPPGKGFTLATLKGDHGYSYSGAVIGVGPITTTGLISIDGAGNLAANYVVSVNGVIVRGSFTGTYTVNPDGTGLVRLVLPLSGSSLNGSFVIVDNGDGTLFTNNDPGIAITGFTKRVGPGR
jgi:hypothetical protein